MIIEIKFSYSENLDSKNVISSICVLGMQNGKEITIMYMHCKVLKNKHKFVQKVAKGFMNNTSFKNYVKSNIIVTFRISIYNSPIWQSG